MWPNKPLIEDVYHDYLLKGNSGSCIYVLLDRRYHTISCLRCRAKSEVSTDWSPYYIGAVMGYHSVWSNME